MQQRVAPWVPFIVGGTPYVSKAPQLNLCLSCSAISTVLFRVSIMLEGKGHIYQGICSPQAASPLWASSLRCGRQTTRVSNIRFQLFLLLLIMWDAGWFVVCLKMAQMLHQFQDQFHHPQHVTHCTTRLSSLSSLPSCSSKTMAEPSPSKSPIVVALNFTEDASSPSPSPLPA